MPHSGRCGEPRGADVEAFAIAPCVETDPIAGRDPDVLFDDAVAQMRARPDPDSMKEDRRLDDGAVLDPHLGKQDRVIDPAAADDGGRA